jgi:hypothetical protein
MAEKFPQKVGWRKAEATVDMRLQHDDLLI